MWSYKLYLFSTYHLLFVYVRTWILNRGACAWICELTLLFTLFFSHLYLPQKKINFFDIQLLIQFLSTFSIVYSSSPVLDLSARELSEGTSLGLEKTQIQCGSYKEKENTEVPFQIYTVNKEQLTTQSGFHLPSKWRAFPIFYLLCILTLKQKFPRGLMPLRLHVFRNIGFLYVLDMKGLYV